MSVDQIFSGLERLTVLELKELKDRIESEWGVTAAALPAPSAGPVAPEAAAEEAASFDVVLTDAGAQKIQVIKLVREVSGLGLKEAKAVADDLGVVKPGLSRAEAEQLLGRLEEAGAKAELRPSA